MKDYDYMTTYADVSLEETVQLDFPSFVDLGGPAIIFDTLLNAPSGLALISGKRYSGKTTTLTALANELSRSGRNVLAVRTPASSAVPGVAELFVNAISPTLEHDLLIGDKNDVIVLDTIDTSEAVAFASKLVSAGILVVGTIEASDPIRALWEFLRLGKSRRNKVVAKELVFSYGSEIYQATGKDSPNPEVISAVKKARELMDKESAIQNDHFHDVSSSILISDYVFPDAVVRNHILGYNKGYLED